MRYAGLALSMGVLLAFIVFLVNNSQEFRLGFMGYELEAPLALWILMLVFFAAGTLPVLATEVFRSVRTRVRRRVLEAEIRSLEEELSSGSGPAKDSREPSPDKP